MTGEAGKRAPHTKPLSCVFGHPIEYQENPTEKKVPEKGYLTCRGCKKVILRPLGVYLCKQECDFTLCLDCAHCADGHTL